MHYCATVTAATASAGAVADNGAAATAAAAASEAHLGCCQQDTQAPQSCPVAPQQIHPGMAQQRHTHTLLLLVSCMTTCMEQARRATPAPPPLSPSDLSPPVSPAHPSNTCRRLPSIPQQNAAASCLHTPSQARTWIKWCSCSVHVSALSRSGPLASHSGLVGQLWP